jgi:aminoglycoside 6-adenylyltransferase
VAHDHPPRVVADAGRFLEQLASWGRDRPDVRAVALVGSQVRADVPADEFSDVDVVLVVEDVAPYIDSASWLAVFGDVLLTFVEPTAVGGLLERRALFASGLEVDFSLVPARVADALLANRDTAAVVARGYRLLYDEIGLTPQFASAETVAPVLPTAAELAQLSHDFWYHALWAAKKLRRGETYVAKQACDCYLKALLVELMATAARLREPELDTWHRGRFLERWATAQELAELGETFARYEPGDVARAIYATIEMFGRLEREVSARVTFDGLADRVDVRRRLDSLLRPFWAQT